MLRNVRKYYKITDKLDIGVISVTLLAIILATLLKEIYLENDSGKMFFLLLATTITE